MGAVVVISAIGAPLVPDIPTMGIHLLSDEREITAGIPQPTISQTGPPNGKRPPEMNYISFVFPILISHGELHKSGQYRQIISLWFGHL